ncbi:hypothetical protein LSAT2_019430 [Lamellibrachia satsuma]|nr:hypothetical protein LSAT2_019430 [Lamellibrachia satsuma]
MQPFCPGHVSVFSRAVLGRANAWLAAAAGPVKLVSCEALDVDGVYRAEDDDDDVTHHVTVSARRDAAQRTMPAFVRVLRLWIQRDSLDSPRSMHSGGGVTRPPVGVPWSVNTRLGCVNIVPCRLESTPHAFGPKFQGLGDMMRQFNDKLDRTDDVIPGRILSIQTSVCRFNSKHCSVDPNRTFWLTSDPDDVHTCYYVHVFYTTTNACRGHVDHIGFRDFPPECGATRRQHRTAPAKAETVSALVRRAGAWLDSQAGSKRLVSMEVLDHRLNYDMYHDTPTPVCQLVDFQPTVCQLVDFQPTVCQLVDFQPTVCRLVDFQPTVRLLVDFQPTVCRLVDFQPTVCRLVDFQPTVRRLVDFQPTAVDGDVLPLPQAIQTTVPQPQAIQTTVRQAIQTTVPQPQAIQTTVPQPQAIQTTVPQPQAIQTTVPQPQAIQTIVPQAIQTTVPQPQAIHATVPQPQAIHTAVPQAIQTTVPHAIQTTVPQAIQTEVPQPQAIQTTVPQAIQTTVPQPQAIQTTVPQAIQTRVPQPQAIHTAVSQAIHTTVSQAIHTTASQAIQTTVPQAIQTTHHRRCHHLRTVLDRPHVVTSLRTTTYHTRAVRVYYTEITTLSGGDNRQCAPNTCKIFHVPVSHRVMDNAFLTGQIDRVLANHTEVERRLARWRHQTYDLEVVFIATVKLITGHDVTQVVSAENCHSVSGRHHINHVIYALVLFARVTAEQRDKNLSPEPKHVRLTHNNCDIL